MTANARGLLRAGLTVVALGTGVLTASEQAARELRFVSPIRPPFSDVQGKPRFALDLVEAALGRINVKATTTLVPPGQYGDALLKGPYDGTAIGWRDGSREQAMLFSDPYMENRLVLVGRSGSDVRAKTFAELKGKRVALVSGYAYGDAIEASGPSFVRTQGEQDSLSRLLNGAVDYVLMDELVVAYLVASYPEESRTRLAIGTIPLLSRAVHLTLHRSLPDAGVIIKGFNAQLRAMITDHTYHRLLHVDWIRADVDGDGKVEYVADSDQVGTTQPKRAYDLFASAPAAPAAAATDQERYFLGGAIYNGWSSVPDKYKVDHLDRPDHTHPTARILTFSWK